MLGTNIVQLSRALSWSAVCDAEETTIFRGVC